MKHVTKIIVVCTGTLVWATGSIYAGPTARLRQIFSRSSQTPAQTMTQEYAIKGSGGITITNPYGSVTIKKEWGQDKVALSTITQCGTNQEMANMTSVQEQQLANGDLVLTIACPHADKKTIVNVELIVPEKRELKVCTATGAITVENIQAGISATTKEGSIQLRGIRGTIVAKTEKNGSITIDKARGNIKATTSKGDITLLNTTESVLASTGKGSVELTCQTLPATGKLNVHAQGGKVLVKLPHEVNADLVAKTKHGAVICDHFVTIKPFTTQWNKQAWRHLKHEICGTLGTGEALISIHNDRGSIKIGKYA